MHAFERRNWEEMAELLETSPAALRKRYHRGLALLREVLESEASKKASVHTWEGAAAALEVLAANIALERTASIHEAADWRLNPSVVITDERVIRYLDEHPEEIHRLAPREFETFVAGLLERCGYDVRLGSAGADGGVDIHGYRHGALRSEYLVVQCKRYAPERKVALPLVKQLRMDALDRRASGGMLVTTSWFSRAALSYIKTNQYQLSAVDSDELRSWMGRLLGRTAGP